MTYDVDEFSLSHDMGQILEALSNQAEMFGMDIDYEKLALLPKDFSEPNKWAEVNSNGDRQPVDYQGWQ